MRSRETNSNSDKALSEIFRRLRAVEKGGEAESPEDKIFDIIFDRLRDLEERAEEWNSIKLKAIGAAGAVSFIVSGILYLWK